MKRFPAERPACPRRHRFFDRFQGRAGGLALVVAFTLAAMPIRPSRSQALAPSVEVADAPDRGAPVVVPHAEQFDLRARSGLDYRIFIAAPEGPVPAGGFPVVYLTDANINFAVVLAAVQKQSRAGLPAIVVGIGYPTDDVREQVARRAFDMTPPTSPEWLRTAPGPMSTFRTGGNDQFLAFIEDELKPFVERRHPIDTTRQTLFGHSFGGLFTLHVLFQRPDAFQTYLASSPSLWWNDSSIQGEAKAFLQAQAGKAVDARVLVSVGEWEQKPSSERPADRRPASGAKSLSATAQGLVSELNAANIPGLMALFREFPEEDHGSVVLPAASRGVRFAMESTAPADAPSGTRTTP